MPDGTQIVIGTVLFVPVALVTHSRCGTKSRCEPLLDSASRTVGRRAILATLAVADAANIGIKAQRLYARGVPLAMPGATDGAHDRTQCGDILVAEREPARKLRRIHHRPGTELTSFLDGHRAGVDAEYHAVAAAVRR